MRIFLSLPIELHKTAAETHIMGLIKTIFTGCEIANSTDEALHLIGWESEFRIFDQICDAKACVFIPHRYHFDNCQKWQMRICYRLKKLVYFTDGVNLVQVDEIRALHE